jgi:hypothetical protein
MAESIRTDAIADGGSRVRRRAELLGDGECSSKRRQVDTVAAARCCCGPADVQQAEQLLRPAFWAAFRPAAGPAAAPPPPTMSSAAAATQQLDGTALAAALAGEGFAHLPMPLAPALVDEAALPFCSAGIRCCSYMQILRNDLPATRRKYNGRRRNGRTSLA